MRKIYHVYVKGEVIKDGITSKLKSEFKLYFDKNEALSYKERLEKRFKNVMLDEKELKNNPFV